MIGKGLFLSPFLALRRNCKRRASWTTNQEAKLKHRYSFAQKDLEQEIYRVEKLISISCSRSPPRRRRASVTQQTHHPTDPVRRLKVALGAARGLAYLHELANPPIIHRDIKTSNILLDERLNAKVADFGLSKLMGDSEAGHLTHVTTQVKGTMGYLDPEYYMTQQLTEKSDVYSFGVVMLELLTGRRPIERGKYVVREVKTALDRAKHLYNLGELLDSSIGLDITLKGLDKYVDVALKCVQENGSDRPTMGEVVKEIENILQLAGLNPNADSASTSASYDDASKGGAKHPYVYSKDAFDYSGGFPVPKLEPL
ncbi:hypothetical protein DKX38_001722 [Salix brachista]|uniref:non-specific serine/threonine protein kinase n=1 Tax=Salix brachista TaxID=2182728 RepID=A0A5N5P5L5_9ROSI|nr:hypothetical protein DKX38_001722 [Salix brachista]